MKTYSTFLALLTFLLATLSLQAQTSGVISYQQKMKIKMEFEGDAGIDIAGMLPDSRTLNYDLTFSAGISKFVEQESDFEDQKYSSGDGSIEIVVMESDIESVLYVDQNKQIVIEQTGFMGRPFLVSQELPKYAWKITAEKVKYLNYECIKATMKTDDDKEVVAWFAPAIPASIGPDLYGQLPGAILMLSVDGDQNEFKATNIAFKDISKIKKPKKGKKVTSEELDQIIDDKMKEMNMQNGGDDVIKINRG